MPRTDKEAQRIYQAQWREQNRESYSRSMVKSQLKRRGITEHDYDAMLDAQDYACAICHTHLERFPRRLAVDHDPETGLVRGLLCASCNMGLGMFQHRASWLENAAAYLDEFHVRPEAAWDKEYA